ncbi:hypothetical protein CAPTEDRAFT_228548 [Capitella teleta]|uniref:Protoporphyrinogen oxidase n=1 Tax=Capitella teleta TaxID=283909 RepID=R7UKV5_CAPTE|nr:hypothetical protein CAPTEDRAFT_228548 [Capitella teleta]|eukprot:ELU06870.1 hypothetical protein CAPTEDRAFT_228548 [Capitella teleta]
MARIAIIGGGISGLSAAYYLSKSLKSTPAKIVLIEAGKQFGGWMESSRFDDGTVFEHGPRSLRGVKSEAGYASLLLAEEIGLESKILSVKKEHPASKYRYIYAKDQLCLMPTGPGDLIKKIPPFTRPLAAFGWKEPFRKSVKLHDESIHDFITRRFGEEIATYAFSAMFRGIYAGDTRKLSIKSCLRPVFDMEQQHGSIIRGAIFGKRTKTEIPKSPLVERFRSEGWSLWSFQGGLQTFPETIASKLKEDPNIELHLNTVCADLGFTVDNKANLKYNGKEEVFDHVISTIPSGDLASLMSKQHSSMATDLNRIPLASVGVVNLQFEGDRLPIQALGHLVPFCEPDRVLGILYDSCSFPGHGTLDRPTTRLSVMMGGAWFEDHFGPVDQYSDDELTEVALKATRDQLGIKEKPFRVISKVAKRGIPQYNVGHSDIVDSVFSYAESKKFPLTILGACYKGISLNDCILNSRNTMKSLGEQMTQ